MSKKLIKITNKCYWLLLLPKFSKKVQLIIFHHQWSINCWLSCGSQSNFTVVSQTQTDKLVCYIQKKAWCNHRELNVSVMYT